MPNFYEALTSDYLNYEFLIRLPPLLNSKMAEFKRESWVEGGCDIIKSRHQNKRGYFSMQKRCARFMFNPSSCFFGLGLL